MMGNVNCLRCRFRHEDNGNCTAVGGFCTAVTAAHCPLLRQYLDTGLTPEEIDMDHEAAETLRQLCRDCDLDRLEELSEADKAGRLVVLPCQVGTATYDIRYPIAVYPDKANRKLRGVSLLCAIWIVLGTPFSSPARRRRKHWRR